jgi:hypothetical protein
MKIVRIIVLMACTAVFCSYSGCLDWFAPILDLAAPSGPAPDKPHSLYPHYNSTNQSKAPLFSWKCDDTNPRYEITYKVKVEPWDGPGPHYEWAADSKFLQCPVTLESDTKYRWRVEAYNQYEVGVSSDEAPFTTGSGFNNPPARPEIIVPVSHGVYPPDVTIQWTGSDPDGDDLTYDVWLGFPEAELDLLSEGQSETEYEAHSLEYGATYRLAIIAHDGESESLPSLYRTFSIIDPGVDNGVYAELIVHRTQYLSGAELTRVDYISARFDSVYAPDGPIYPLHPAAVSCSQPGAAGGYDLVWQDGWKRYYYSNPYAGYFLGTGVEYLFTITGGDGVPSLVTDPIFYLECRPYITSPEAYSTVTLEGLELVWANYDTYPDCDRPVTIKIFDLNGDWTDVLITTENDGSYTFTSGDVAGIPPYAYQLQIVLIVDTRENITAAGYDPRSWIETSTWATLNVYRQL